MNCFGGAEKLIIGHMDPQRTTFLLPALRIGSLPLVSYCGAIQTQFHVRSRASWRAFVTWQPPYGAASKVSIHDLRFRIRVQCVLTEE